MRLSAGAGATEKGPARGHPMRRFLTKNARPLVAMALFIITIAALGRVVENDFVNYDDNIFVTEERYVGGGLDLEDVRWAFTNSEVNIWHPLTWLSHMLDVELFGLDPAGHHLTSLGIHAVNTVLLFLALSSFSGGFWQSAFVAALFGLHPLHVESVAWIAERKDVLSTFFWLTTLWLYAVYVRRPKWSTWLLALGSYALALMAKPMVVTLPVILLLLDVWPLERYRDHGLKLRLFPDRIRRSRGWVLVWEKLPFFGLSLISGITTIFVRGIEPPAILSYSFAERLANVPINYIHYMLKTVWPSGLAVFYPPPLLSEIWPWRTLGALLLLMALTAAVLRQRRRRTYLLVGWAWFVMIMVPVIGFLQVGRTFKSDHNTYVSIIGLFIMVAWGGRDLAARFGRPKALAAAAAIVILAAGLLSFVQAGYWRDSTALFRHNLEVTPLNWLAHNNLGVDLVGHGYLDEGIAHLRQAQRLMPYESFTLFNLGAALEARGNYEEAVKCLEEAVWADPSEPRGFYNLGNLLLKIGQPGEAVESYRDALAIDPAWHEARNNLGVALARLGRTGEAAEQFREVLAAYPAHAGAHNNLGKTLLVLGGREEAIAHFREAIRLKPDYTDARLRLEEALGHIKCGWTGDRSRGKLANTEDQARGSRITNNEKEAEK